MYVNYVFDYWVDNIVGNKNIFPNLDIFILLVLNSFIKKPKTGLIAKSSNPIRALLSGQPSKPKKRTLMRHACTRDLLTWCIVLRCCFETNCLARTFCHLVFATLSTFPRRIKTFSCVSCDWQLSLLVWCSFVFDNVRCPCSVILAWRYLKRLFILHFTSQTDDNLPNKSIRKLMEIQYCDMRYVCSIWFTDEE